MRSRGQVGDLAGGRHSSAAGGSPIFDNRLLSAGGEGHLVADLAGGGWVVWRMTGEKRQGQAKRRQFAEIGKRIVVE